MMLLWVPATVTRLTALAGDLPTRSRLAEGGHPPGRCQPIAPPGRSHLLAAAVLWIGALSAFAQVDPPEIINVAPGLDTLQAAIDGAPDGSTLLLQDGTYTDTGEILVRKPLTIRPSSAGVVAVISDEIDIGSTSGAVTIQGLELRDRITYDSPGTVALLENTFVNTTIASDFTTDPSQFYAVGNRFTSTVGLAGNTNSGSVGGRVEISAISLMYFAGNVIEVAPGIRLEVLAFHDSGDPTMFFVGNELVGGHFQSQRILDTSVTSNWIIANRFETRLDVDNGVTDAHRPATIAVSATGRHHITNNLFTITDSSAIASSTTNVTGLNAVAVGSGAAGTEIRNNVFDFRDIMFDPSSSAKEGVIDQDGFAIIEGNLFVGATRPNRTFSAGTEMNNSFAFNLCFNTFEACGTADGNLDADPLFVDTLDYRLDAESPGIDAGPTTAFLTDLDGTRLDLGLYGGSFPIDQYDVQREDMTTAPWVYPLFDAARSVNVIGDLSINVLGFARLR